MTTNTITEADKTRAKTAATAASCLYNVDADEVDTMIVDGFAPSAGGYVSTYRVSELEKEVQARLGDEWSVVVSHEVEELNEVSVSVQKDE